MNVYWGTPSPDVINGSGEDDFFYAYDPFDPLADDGGPDDDDVFYGNGGSDGAVIGGGNDTVYGGEGDDYVVIVSDSQWGGDTFLGGTGLDVLSFGSSTQSITDLSFSLDDLTIERDGTGFILTSPDGRTMRVEGVEVIHLNSPDGFSYRMIAADSLFTNTANSVDFNALATDQRDLLAASGGSGIYAALDGDDIVQLPDIGNVDLAPGVSWDHQTAFDGGAGDDTITGGDFNDIIDGGADSDFINGMSGSDVLRGGDGADWLIASREDVPGEFDRLDGGTGRDIFNVNQGDEIAAFERVDDRIVFETAHPVERIAIIYDRYTGTTEVRAYANDLETYESFTIDAGVRPEYLTARIYAGEDSQGIVVENVNPRTVIFDFALDQEAALQATLASLTDTLEPELLKAAIGDGGVWAAEHMIREKIAEKAAQKTVAAAQEFLASHNIALNATESIHGILSVIVKWVTGKYDGNKYQMAQDIGVALSSWLGPFGQIGFKVGTEIAADLIGRVVFAMNDSLLVSYNQVKFGRTATATDADDVLIIESDGSQFTLNDGNDLLVVPEEQQQNSEFAAAAASSRTINGGNGADTIAYALKTSVSVDLASGVAKGSFGFDSLVSVENAGGGSAADLLIGNSGANELWGNAGNDRLEGRGGVDRLLGGAGADRLYGGDGADTLDGGAGDDVMYGGRGDDTYIADALSDAPIELIGEGVDTVLASRAHTLKANVEHLTMTGIYSIHGRGNGLDNTITGNSGSNRMWGEGGNDRLVGNEGNDQLDGGAGNDAMLGGLGNDIYFVDSSGDTIVEEVDYGRDTVRTAIDWTLGDNLEWLELQGTADLNGTGNALANVLKGNSGANVLTSLAGNDKIYAGAGDDTVDGGDGNDWLEGEEGRDSYTGGAGSDRFVFRDGDFGGATTDTADVITDFGDAEGDRIRLDLADADTTIEGDQDFVFIAEAAFSGTAGELRFEQIEGNTYVQGDTNGDGVADFMIRIDGLHTLGGDDFIF